MLPTSEVLKTGSIGFTAFLPIKSEPYLALEPLGLAALMLAAR